MKAFISHVCLVVVIATVALAAGCAGAAPPPPPTAVPSPTAMSTPVPTPMPSPSPTPSPTPADARALLRQAQDNQEAVKSYRSQMVIVVEGTQTGEAQSVKMTMDFVVAEPDMHMRLSSEGSPLALEMEMIAKDNVLYMKMGEQWMAMGDAENLLDSGDDDDMGLTSPDQVEQFLALASDVRTTGRRKIKGVECDVISFTIPPEKMQELMALRGGMATPGSGADDVQIKTFQGELAIGSDDMITRQLVMKMSGADKAKPNEKFGLSIWMTLWDVNDPSIAVKAPVGVKPLPQPAPTPGPAAAGPSCPLSALGAVLANRPMV
ncbi:MAG: LppX_LprAFG lipoprotein [Dehalococcoidales bacterium]|nr:LppX_LprAFG lipoprotein [Dehalococcoidales bacterium]